MFETNQSLTQALSTLSSSERSKLQTILRDFSSQKLKLKDLTSALHSQPTRGSNEAYSDEYWECKWQATDLIVSGRHLTRWGASSACIENKLYLYGGRGFDSRPRNSLHVIDLENNSVTLFRAINLPIGREGHSMVSYKNLLIIFGGCEGGKDDEQSFDDLWIVDIEKKTWINPDITGKKPKGREGHSAGIIRNFMVIYGGKGQGELYSDMYAYNLNTFEWRELEQSGQLPGPRESMSLAVVNDLMYVFGGNTSSDPEVDEYTNDLYVIHFKANSAVCKKILPKGALPPKRLSHSMASLHGLFLIICGGESFGKALNDVWVFDIELKIWREIKPQNELKARMTHVCYAYKDSMYIFGGMFDEKTVFSDMCVLTFGSNKKPNSSSLPTERAKAIQAPVTKGSQFACYKCGHDSNSCAFYERYPEIGTPVLNFFTRVQIPPFSLSHLISLFPDCFSAILLISDILSPSEVFIRHKGEIHIRGNSISKLLPPNSNIDLSFLPLNTDDDESEIRSKMLKDWKSFEIAPLQVIELYAQNELSPVEISKIFSGFSNAAIVPAMLRLSDIGLMISKGDELTSVFIMHKAEHFTPIYNVVIDNDQNIVFPHKEIVHANFSNILAHSHLNSIQDISDRPNGTYVYLYCKNLQIGEGDIKQAGDSLAALLAKLQHLQFNLLGRQIEFLERNRMKITENSVYSSFRTDEQEFELLVYCQRKLVFWEYKRADKAKRAREECIEVKLKDKGFINNSTGLLNWNVRTMNVMSDISPAIKKTHLDE